MTYAYFLSHSHGLPLPEVACLIGGKAANLGVMLDELGLPVPPGFVITTAACRQYLKDGWPRGLDAEIRGHIVRVEDVVGRRFGDPADPLLVSVRSGAPVSMPGMMDTILNLGLNEETAEGLTALSGDRGFVDACRRRFLDTYNDIVGTVAPDDPWLQLRGAIEAVFRSWNSDRARSYRAREEISDDLGTAVIIQTMVFGNRSDDSATGVLFTRNPATGDPDLYGDIMFKAQGEDVVGGTHQTEPMSVLDERMPQIAAELRGYASMLEHHYADVCDIEFTIEQGKLWLLQTRIGKRSPQAALRIAVDMAENDDFPLTRAQAVERVASYLVNPPTTSGDRSGDALVVATGLGASPGVASGEIVTTPEAAVLAAEAGKTVLLVRRETSPHDVHGMAKAAGILTSTGGLTSHAAVVARGWGIPAVVGASTVEIDGESVVIGQHRYVAGDILTIDGSTGDIFAGAVSSGTEIVPEVVTLLLWAEELGNVVSDPEYASDEERQIEMIPARSGEVTVGDIIRVVLIKGLVSPDDLAPVMFTTPDEVGTILGSIVADGLADPVGGMFQLTAHGKAVGAEGIAADRELWGAENAEHALDGLLPLDHRMKEIVTSWQMREFNGQQIINDHTDEVHDSTVLAEFRSLHADASKWLRTLVDGLPRLGAYLARLERAAGMVDGGDSAYLASPRVDSYHSVWFELHEDLIILAGRTREQEVASGRA